jgi:hypothetical protein
VNPVYVVFRNHMLRLLPTASVFISLNTNLLHSFKTPQIHCLRILNYIINTHGHSTHRAEFMLELLCAGRVAAEIGAGREAYRDLGW